MLARLKHLGRNLLIYGLGDAAGSAIGFLLLPLYVRYLSPEDYGVIGLLLAVEVVSKILFRWGVDASFMRLYFDCPDQPARQRLASTIFIFLAAANGSLLLTALVGAPWLAGHLFGQVSHVTALRLVLISTFVNGFNFIPFHVMRITGRSPQFIALTVSRSLATLVLRLLFVIRFEWGVLGVVLADVVVTAVFSLTLTRWFAPLIRPVFSRAVLGEILSFGLPRLPHGIAHQITAVADRYILRQFVTLAEIGLYSIGATFGLTMKLFLSAFEYTWAPFYFSLMREPDAKRTFSLVTTYGIAVLVLLAAGLTVIAADLVRLMTRPEFYAASAVIPWIALGVVFQGIYLLTSIGLNITKQTAYYPIATLCSASVNVVANLLLIPRFGALGAALANALSYAVLASAGMYLSQRFYPIRYETSRIARIVLAGGSAVLAAQVLVPAQLAPLPRLLIGGTLVVIVYLLVLVVTGFYHARELAAVATLFRRPGAPRTAVAVEESAELAGEVVSAPMMDETADDDRLRSAARRLPS